MRSCLVLFLPIALALAAGASAGAVELHRSLEAARQASPGAKPAVLIFGADWCGWCRKYETTTLADERLAEAGKGYLWVKVDVDRQPELAAQYGASGVPLTVALDASGAPIGARAGYMTVDDLMAFVEQSIANPQPWSEPAEGLIKRLRQADSPEALRQATLDAVERLAMPDRQARKPLLEALAARGASAWPAMLDLLEDERLSVRAAAFGALAQALAKPLPYNPFAESGQRKEQAAAWREALSKEMSDRPRRPESPAR